jgi:hypothetical protein
MSNNEPVTRPTDASVDDFLASVANERRRADAMRLREIMEDVTGEPAVMWGPTIVGFGAYHYRYASGHEGDAPAVGFSPRAANTTIYMTGGFDGLETRLEALGKHKTGKGCLYITRLDAVDEHVLRDLIQTSVRRAAEYHVAST